ncbi:MAG: acetyl-CoA carboxylase biotin carboxylase subunit [Phycisphaerae bacterium]|nr:acetyl-CoA carboxylase biotin carboxylase subunit [Phycisphaerae bacterium]
MLSRILVANRGEIALRIIRACREMGIQTVAVYSEADRDATYLRLADRAICIGPASPADSYLKADRIIAAAEIANVDAIHPGYGFLSENPLFADQCRESKMEFIGPSAESMRQLGDKVGARKLAKKARVPIVPGSADPLEADDEAVDLAEEIGYPVMIKAVAGGGGRGMRVAHNRATLLSSLRSARAEADASFKNPGIYLEKLLDQPRHVEVQILADQQGNVIHLWDRDCTLQRRYQKLIEETPSPGIDQSTREELCRAAVRLAKAAGYASAGTVEFLVDRKKNFYFIEANARIQVEHPVTEMVTGIDLVKWQIRIASGETLDIKQRDVVQNGVAIECRINAEDPANGFSPSPGRIDTYIPAGGFGVRIDTHVHPGYVVSPRYDSLIGKLIVHQSSRDEAVACMKRCLEEFVIEPIKTTLPLYREIFTHTHFLRGKVDTGFIERTW